MGIVESTAESTDPALVAMDRVTKIAGDKPVRPGDNWLLVEILSRRRETRRQTENTNFDLRHQEEPATRRAAEKVVPRETPLYAVDSRFDGFRALVCPVSAKR